MSLKHLSDRKLLENIYLLLIEVHKKSDKIDDDDRQLGINIAADLMSNVLYKKSN